MTTDNRDKEVTSINPCFDFSKVPSWYALCTNDACPKKAECLRFLSGSHTPENVECSTCVLPKTLKNGECRWFDKITVEVWAAGFSHLYDKVMKADYSTMRKAITRHLSGCRYYYEYMHGERPLSPEQQQWIRKYVKSFGYDWEVEFDRYFESYTFHDHPLAK